MSKGTPQAIIISGESGSGKTEATKKCLQYLSTVAPSSASKAGKKVDATTPADSDISKRVLATNPLLEAFGNAKTVRNDNSSRFGKLLKAQFTKDRGELVGACIVSYLLEKSRITRQNAEERNFHIFFQMCAALPDAARAQLSVGAASSFTYLASSVACPSIDDVTDFEDTVQAMVDLGVSESDRQSVFSTTAAVLHLGNITFDVTDTAAGPGSMVSTDDASYTALVKAAELLQVSADRLAEDLCTQTIRNPRETIRKTLTAQAAQGKIPRAPRFPPAPCPSCCRAVLIHLVVVGGLLSSLLSSSGQRLETRWRRRCTTNSSFGSCRE